MTRLTRSLLWIGLIAAGVAACQPAAVPRPAIEADAALTVLAASTNAAGTISKTFTVRWVDDSAGTIDTLVTTATGPATRCPTSPCVQRFAQPSNPQSVTYVWDRPTAGQTLSVVVTANLIRRGKISGTGSVSWSFTQPDVVPPTPVIDTVLVIADGVELYPKALSVKVGQGTWLCGFIRFGDGKVAYPGVVTPPVCDSTWRAVYSVAERSLSPAQRARADSVCVVWRVDGQPAQPCPIGVPPALQRGVRLAAR